MEDQQLAKQLRLPSPVPTRSGAHTIMVGEACQQQQRRQLPLATDMATRKGGSAAKAKNYIKDSIQDQVQVKYMYSVVNKRGILS